jgi:hypothetical protein
MSRAKLRATVAPACCPHQRNGEPCLAQKLRSAEEQDEAGGVDDGEQRDGRELQQPVLVYGDDEQGLVADEDQGDGGGEEHEAPPGSVGLPPDLAPVAEDERAADEGDGHADGFQRVGLPDVEQRIDRVVDGEEADGGAQTGQADGDFGREGEGV